ncbi:ABC transporter ATP-binding protein [Hellea balneolensis]|uniref:ABC transporter ATP-binding protein n=1 Tax=Hellea balneolensis TaxID=287478 RepID=UPI00040828C5|nr:ABC transporter ATP-binding protein [Hellea balneolensis]
MSTTSKENRAYLKRAWRHILGAGLWRHKARAAFIFLTGFLTTAIQIFAVLLLVGAARAYDAEGLLSYGPVNIDLSKSAGNNQLIYAILAGIMLVLSILAGIGHKLIVTRIGRQFYEDLLNDTRQRLVSAVKSGRGFDRSSYLQYLSRDCRYLSLSYIRVMNLIQPALLLISVFVISFITVPIAAAFLGMAALLVLPLNIYLILWAARTSQDIQNSAKLKSKEEADFVTRVSSDPFITESQPKELIKADRPGEVGFLGAFVKRQRMSAYSQSITDLMMALVVIALAVFLFFGGGNTLLLKLSSLLILLILFRFITGYISNLSQAIMMVSSYEPFFRPLLDLHGGQDTPHLAGKLKGSLERPVRAAVFQAKKSDWSDVSTIAAALKLQSSLQIVTADFTAEKSRITAILDAATEHELKLSDTVKSELQSFSEGASDSLSNPAKLFLTLSFGAAKQDTGFLIDGALLRDLDRLDLRTIFGAAGDKPIIIVYRSVPRRLVLPPRFQLISRSASDFSLICNAHEFTEKRDIILERMQTPLTPQGIADDNGENAADIIV